MPRWGGTTATTATTESQSPKKQINKNENDINDSVNINNLNQEKSYNITDDPNQFTISYVKQFSPRSHEAMRRQGVVPREIVHKSLEYFDSRLPGTVPKDIAKIRYNHHQNKRKNLIRELKKTRQQIISSRWAPMPIIAKSASTSMLNSQKSSPSKMKHRGEKRRRT